MQQLFTDAEEHEEISFGSQGFNNKRGTKLLFFRAVNKRDETLPPRAAGLVLHIQQLPCTARSIPN